MNLPRHLVLVPDGNRRWAKKRGKPPFFGHRAGAKTAEAVFKEALDLGLECLTFWGCSVSNITERDPLEVKFLHQVFERAFAKFEKRIKDLKKYGIRVRVLGRWEELFPERTKKIIRRLEKATAGFGPRKLTFLMAYDGRDEMQSAVVKIAEAKAKDPNLLIDRELIKNSLWAADLPPVDLVIRTGGEPHWSAGLMMWDVAEARLYFTEVTWPDFDPGEFRKALGAYGATERRYGR